MNNNRALQLPVWFELEDEEVANSMQGMDTKIHACQKCVSWLVGEDTFRIHMKESHNDKLSAEHDAIDGTIN